MMTTYTTLKHITTVSHNLILGFSDNYIDIDYDEEDNVIDTNNLFLTLELSGGVHIDLSNCILIPSINGYEIHKYIPCDKNGKILI